MRRLGDGAPAPAARRSAVTLAERLEHYHRLEPQGTPFGTLYLKPGVRGYPEPHPAGLLLAARAELGGGRLLDASATLGLPALALNEGHEVTVLEPSYAALRCLRATFAARPGLALAAGAPWDAPAGAFDAVCLAPATDRGSLRAYAELQGGLRALAPGGVLYAAMHKDQGAKRYEKRLAALAGGVEVIARAGGWRLVRASKGDAPACEVLRFAAAGLELEAEPGVYAAGKLDPGTTLLLEAFGLDDLAGKRVLDLGCGYGLLALRAALAGAEVTALDDDLTAVRSTHRNALRYGLDVRALHSDVDSVLRDGERFDLILTNPPFHVGKQVRLELPAAFIAAAHRRLAPGSALLLVANAELAYEPLLAQFASWEELARSRGFKVLRARA